MEGAHFHLMVNHFPIIGNLIGMLILLAGIILKNNTVKSTGLLTLVFAVLSTFIVLLSGDPAGDAVKGLPGVTEAMIEHHESVAYGTLWGMIPMALLASLAFYSIYKKEKAGNTLAVVTFIMAIVTSGLMAWAGLTGGEIRHTEIRSVSSEQIQDTETNSPQTIENDE